MEKLMYPLWKRSGLTGDDFRAELLEGLAPVLLAAGDVHALRIAVVDTAVKDAAPKRMETCHTLPDGLISLWLCTASSRAAVEEAIAASVAGFASYLVTESEPIVNTRHPIPVGERGYGFCQVVFLRRPPRLSEPEWLSLWLDSHTQVAIDTQSTYAYRQNVIVRALGAGSPAFDAVIEESFPPEAMTSEQAFFGVTDDQALQQNSTAMLESCARFIDFDRIDVVPMSEYVLRACPE
jgi:hypothetical protein